jgi:hypothetical protein
MTKFIFESLDENGSPGPLHFAKEDSGQALIGETTSENGLFVHIRSWDTQGEHVNAKTLAGKRVRVTVETIDE